MLTKQQSDALYSLIKEWEETRDRLVISSPWEAQAIQDCIDDLLEVIENEL